MLVYQTSTRTGYDFIWLKSLGTHVIEEKLDRALTNETWFHLFLRDKLEHLVAPTSDNYLI